MFRAWESAVCMLLFICENVGAQILPEVPSRDVQGRIQLALDYDIRPKLVLTALGEVRPGKDVSQSAEELFVTGASYSPFRFASFGTGYVYIHANFHITGLDSESRVYLQARFNTPAFHGFAFLMGFSRNCGGCWDRTLSMARSYYLVSVCGLEFFT
jgi:hypothetical protein